MRSPNRSSASTLPSTDDDADELVLINALIHINTKLKDNQEATVKVISELQSNLIKYSVLRKATEDTGPAPSRNLVIPEEEKEEGDGLGLERTMVRLSGLEVYAVVSALTLATAIQCFDAIERKDWLVLITERRMLELAGDALFMICSATGIIAGLHSTLVFSLMTMYGRTAVGMARDDAFATFFANTGLQRYHGFQSFLYSMYAFLLQVVIMFTHKTPAYAKIAAFLVILYAMYTVYSDTRVIIDNAGIIFMPRAEKEEEEWEEEEELGEDLPKKDKRNSLVENKGLSVFSLLHHKSHGIKAEETTESESPGEKDTVLSPILSSFMAKRAKKKMPEKRLSTFSLMHNATHNTEETQAPPSKTQSKAIVSPILSSFMAKRAKKKIPEKRLSTFSLMHNATHNTEETTAPPSETQKEGSTSPEDKKKRNSVQKKEPQRKSLLKKRLSTFSLMHNASHGEETKASPPPETQSEVIMTPILSDFMAKRLKKKKEPQRKSIKKRLSTFSLMHNASHGEETTASPPPESQSEEVMSPIVANFMAKRVKKKIPERRSLQKEISTFSLMHNQDHKT
jgi:hypothetical protein